MTSSVQNENSILAFMRNYPDEYAISTTTKGGLKILIRPMRRDDGPRLRVLFSNLSPKSIYFRFFMPLKTLSEGMLDNLTKIDHARDVVLVAAEKTGSEERILGVFRLMRQPDGETGELAIVVGDPWQGKGVAAKLFEHGLFISKEKGIGSVCGMVMAENKTVLALAQRLGFRIRWDSDAHAFELRMDLKSIDPKHLFHSLQKASAPGELQ